MDNRGGTEERERKLSNQVKPTNKERVNSKKRRERQKRERKKIAEIEKKEEEKERDGTD